MNFGNYTASTSSPGNVDMFLARYDLNGNCMGVRNTKVDIQSPNPSAGYRLAQENNGTCYVAGLFKNTSTFGSQSITSLGDKDIFIAKINAITGLGEAHKVNGNQLLIYANPTQGKCTITIPDEFINEKNLILSVYDNNGKIIQQKILLMNDDKIKLDLQAEAKGTYNVTLSNKIKSYSGKIVFE